MAPRARTGTRTKRTLSSFRAQRRRSRWERSSARSGCSAWGFGLASSAPLSVSVRYFSELSGDGHGRAKGEGRKEGGSEGDSSWLSPSPPLTRPVQTDSTGVSSTGSGAHGSPLFPGKSPSGLSERAKPAAPNSSLTSCPFSLLQSSAGTLVTNLQLEIATEFEAGHLASWLGSGYLLGLGSFPFQPTSNFGGAKLTSPSFVLLQPPLLPSMED